VKLEQCHQAKETTLQSGFERLEMRLDKLLTPIPGEEENESQVRALICSVEELRTLVALERSNRSNENKEIRELLTQQNELLRNVLSASSKAEGHPEKSSSNGQLIVSNDPPSDVAIAAPPTLHPGSVESGIRQRWRNWWRWDR
jgi:hypothetical protein